MNNQWLELCENNPFSNNAAAGPWDNKYPDIISINSEAFRNIGLLLNQKQNNPREPVAALVLGESGSGKTHLLRRIRLSVQTEGSVSFVNIRPVLDPDFPVRNLLKGIMVDIFRSTDKKGGSSTICRLLNKIFFDWANANNKRVPKKISSVLKNTKSAPDHKQITCILKKNRREVKSYLLNKNRDLNKEFLEVLLQLGSLNKERILFDWLAGNTIDKRDCKKIGVVKRSDKTKGIIEEEAREIIISLGILMEIYHESAIICFDQLDTIKNPDLVDAFGSIIHTLVNETYSMMPVAFVRADSWNTFFFKKMDPAVFQRLEMNKFALSGCTRGEALEIIHSRISYFLGDNSENLYTSFRNEIEESIKEGYSPRQIILLANRKLHDLCSNDLIPISINDLLKNEFQAEFRELCRDFKNFPPDAGLLKYALSFLLKSRVYISDIVKTEKDRVNLYATLKLQKGDSIYVGFIINTSNSHYSVRSCAERGIQFMNNETRRCIYITDSRCTLKKPGWKVTNKRMEEFIKRGGSVWNLEDREVQRWYALALLILKTENGDLMVEGEDGILRMITRVEIDLFLESEFHLPSDPHFPYTIT